MPLDFKSRVIELYQNHYTNREIAEIILREFPDQEPGGLYERVRSTIRRSPEYKGVRIGLSEATKSSLPMTQSPTENNRQDFLADGSIVSQKIVSISDSENITPELLLKKHGYDADEWEVVEATSNFWGKLPTADGLAPSYQTKIRIKPRNPGELTFKEIKAHYEAMVGQPLVTRNIEPQTGDYLLEVNIADMHVGKLASHLDAEGDYDYQIAKELWYNIIGQIVLQNKDRGDISEVLFVWSNDFFNSQSIEQTTVSGTRQDTDTREKKLYLVGCEMLVRGIKMLTEIAPVKTFCTPSNHDETVAYHALCYAAAWFRNDEKVAVDLGQQPRYYYRFGETLLGFAHGHREKPARLAVAMSVECKKWWACTLYKEFHTAHLHTEQAIVEDRGIIIRRISSPVVSDRWHTEEGYVGQVRKAQTFLYERNRGLQQITMIQGE